MWPVCYLSFELLFRFASSQFTSFMKEKIVEGHDFDALHPTSAPWRNPRMLMEKRTTPKIFVRDPASPDPGSRPRMVPVVQFSTRDTHISWDNAQSLN